jgi:hypothetical protein
MGKVVQVSSPAGTSMGRRTGGHPAPPGPPCAAGLASARAESAAEAPLAGGVAGRSCLRRIRRRASRRRIWAPAEGAEEGSGKERESGERRKGLEYDVWGP